MKIPGANWLIQKISLWFTKENISQYSYLCSFDRIRQEVRSGDVLLIEGRNRISGVIKQVTQSTWSHAALYIGRLHEIEDAPLREWVQETYKIEPSAQLIVESLLGKGTIINRLSYYQKHHIRICRPQGLSIDDAQKVINFALRRVGRKYNIRHIFDLYRLLVPWAILPRRWRSSLFEYGASKPTEEICSSMIAEAFTSVDFPILPLIEKDGNNGKISLIKRNPRLFTPSDFDYSPFFAIIKYPIFPSSTQIHYHDLPWKHNVISNDKSGLLDISQVTPKKNKKDSE